MRGARQPLKLTARTLRCTITAAQPGNGNYNAANNVSQTFNITGPTVGCMDGTTWYVAGPPNPSIVYTWSIVDGSGNPSSAGSIPRTWRCRASRSRPSPTTSG